MKDLFERLSAGILPVTNIPGAERAQADVLEALTKFTMVKGLVPVRVTDFGESANFILFATSEGSQSIAAIYATFVSKYKARFRDVSTNACMYRLKYVLTVKLEPWLLLDGSTPIVFSIALPGFKNSEALKILLEALSEHTFLVAPTST